MAKKKLYSKPEIKQVRLVPGEAVLTGCKTVKNAPGPSTKCDSPQSPCLTEYGS